MKQTFKTLFAAVTLFIAGTSISSAQEIARAKAEVATIEWRYELECAGTGTDGTYLVRVFSYSKKPKIAIEQAKKNAVHGIVFKGFAGGGQGCVSQKPLANSPAIEQEKAEFFMNFFADGGKYMKYVNSSGDGTPESTVKVGKEYKVGIVVSVAKELLRKDLEAAGIIRGLASGF